MNNFDPQQFVDSQTQTYLPPLFKGNFFYYTPHWSIGQNNDNTALRRYVFRYEKDAFVYLATRQGQRSGGPNTLIPAYNIIFQRYPNVSEYNTFTYTSGNKYESSSNNYIEYNATSSSWEWYVRPQYDSAGPNPYTFALSAYSGPTSSNLATAGTINEVDWTINYVFTSNADSVKITSAVAYNNNSLEELNRNPIKNFNADIPLSNGRNHSGWYSGTPEGRPACITDDLLFRCFQGVHLKPYDTVFIEVMWRKYYNKNSYVDYYGNNNFPKQEYEWFVPKPVYIRNQKGRIYRIGKLEKDTGIGNYDVVTLAQRTGILTYRPISRGPSYSPEEGGKTPFN